MRCEEIQERFIDLLYDEPGISSDRPELEEHIRSCPRCRSELAELGNARELLQVWKDEPPAKPVQVGGVVKSFPLRRFPIARVARYGAVAAMLLLAFLALANAELTWNSEEFAFKTHWASPGASVADYYTKEEVLNILKEVLDDYEVRMTEANLLMIGKSLDMVEADRRLDLQRMVSLNQNRNDD